MSAYNTYSKKHALRDVLGRTNRKISLPQDKTGQQLKMSEYFGENVFNIQKAKDIPQETKEELKEVVREGRPLSKKQAEVVATALLNWAESKGVTHFCHWFQPLTGVTAEKHDSFLTLDDDGVTAIEHLSASQLIQGEPDASSFPHGGSRSTFEARGYTSWDLTSPIFIIEGINGKTLCIPCGFVSYHGDALDTKTPLLRSINVFDKVATKFLHLVGEKDAKHVQVTVGAEQEYFLIDKSFYFMRPDLVMAGRSLLGSLTPKNQQLEDHYFGAIEDRVLSFMQELDIELYRLGIPAKTRHNEVAPGQYEIAQIFREGNLSSDNNQVMMATIKRLALKHDFVALLHEKPFAGVNGSGKHLNWSMADDLGNNLLSPGATPGEHYRFLAVVAMILETVNRRADVLRGSIASHGNDFRLGANEAPPSIISVFLGDTLTSLIKDVAEGREPAVSKEKSFLSMGANQLAQLFQDNTDRNRTSPFAFTGNKFEFRAVGSSAAVSFPASILVGALTEVFDESNRFLEAEMKKGASVEEGLKRLTAKWYKQSSQIIFNGDGYSGEWVQEAKRRGLPNFRTTPEAIKVFKDEKRTKFLVQYGIFSERELDTRYNVFLERYLKVADIEFKTMGNLIDQFVLPACLEYKSELLKLMEKQKALGFADTVEKAVYTKLSDLGTKLLQTWESFEAAYEKIHCEDHQLCADRMATELMPLFAQVSQLAGEIERHVPEKIWPLPTYYEMLFVR